MSAFNKIKDSGTTTTHFTDNTGSGTVTYNVNNNNYNVSYDNGSGHGIDNDISYSHDDEGQYTTQDLNTGEIDAGWNGGSYHQSANGLQTFNDKNIRVTYIDFSKFKGTKKEILNSIKSYAAYHGKNFAIGGVISGHSYAGTPGAIGMGFAFGVIGYTFGGVIGLGVESFTNINEIKNTLMDDFSSYTLDEFVNHEKLIY